jgi:hypothetical protein
MKTNRLLRSIVVMAAVFLSPVCADDTGPWGPGYANLPDVIDTWFADEATLNAQLAGPSVTEELVAVLNPQPNFQGRGMARYKLFDDTASVARVLNINLRLRLVRNNGTVANPTIGLTQDNAAGAWVTAYLSRDSGLDEFAEYAVCRLVFGELVVGDDGVAYYATYGLTLREDQNGFLVVGSIGACTEPGSTPEILPTVQALDIVDIGVLVDPPTGTEVEAVLMGSF